MSEVMESVLGKLTNKLRAKAIFKKMTLPQIGHMMEAAIEVRESKIVEAHERQIIVNKQAGAIEEARRILAEAGLAMDEETLKQDAKAAARAVRKKHDVNPNKYKATDKKGNVRHWSGHGHMPVQMKEIVEKSPKKERVTKESFLIGHDFKWSHAFKDLRKCNKVADLQAA